MSDQTNTARFAAVRILRAVAEAADESSEREMFRNDEGELITRDVLDARGFVARLIEMARALDEN